MTLKHIVSHQLDSSLELAEHQLSQQMVKNYIQIRSCDKALLQTWLVILTQTMLFPEP